ncbi:MAG: immunoglobulin domain-containing protein [Limisphaerales bacterium]
MLAVLPVALQAQTAVNVLTYHNDNARTGQNLNETILTPANVNVGSFGKLFSYPVDGYVYAQPLYLAGVSIPGQGTHNVVFVATEHDSVYAFDADSNTGSNAAPLWQRSLINAGAGESTVPVSDLGFSDPLELGITGTPVIDPGSGTLFVVAEIKTGASTSVNTTNTSGGNTGTSGGVTNTQAAAAGDAAASGASTTYAERLYALDVATGAIKFGGPVDIQATVPGIGDGTDGLGHVPFDPLHEFQRPGLVLANGIVYVTFASVGDVGPYHGWVIGYDAHTLQQVSVFNDTPNGSDGGIWMSGAAPAVDPAGNLYFMTGNGTFDADAGGKDFGDSFVKLTPAGQQLLVTDYFTPFDQAWLDSVDGDLGSGGPLVLPDAVGSAAHPHLLVGCGKEGTIYLLDRDAMGHYNLQNNNQIVQSLALATPQGTWSMPAYFNGSVYYLGFNDVLKAFRIANGQLSPAPISQSTVSFGYPGATPSISADGTNNAIVWALQADAFDNGGPAVLHAYNATNLAQELYDSTQAGSLDVLGLAQKFSVPTIVNGKVYVGTGFGLSVFGLLSAPAIETEPTDLTVNAGTEVDLEVTARGTEPLHYQWQFNGTNLPGATNPTLVLANVSTAKAGDYTVVVTNLTGAVTSDAALLTVGPPAVPPVLSFNPQAGMTLQGTVGSTYLIEATTDLVSPPYWVTVQMITLTNSVQSWIDPDAANQPQRFYRARLGSL